MQWRIPLIIREAHSLPRSRTAFSSINWVCSAPLPEIVPYWSQIYSICLTSHSFKFRCHPIVINLTEVEGSANGIHIFFFYPADLIESWKYSWERLYQVANLPQHPLQYFPIPPCVDVKSQPWGSQTQTMWSLRGPSEAFPPLSSQSAGRFLFV